MSDINSHKYLVDAVEELQSHVLDSSKDEVVRDIEHILGVVNRIRKYKAQWEKQKGNQ